MTPWSNASIRRRRRTGGFTLIELLVAVSLVIVLISLIIVALNQSQRTAQRVNTQVLMNSIEQGLIQFREDIGYLPPVLDANRSLLSPPGIVSGSDISDYDEDIQDWYSLTTLAEYLIGYDNGPRDGFGAKDPSQPPQTAIEDIPFPGIRHPGADGVWGAGPGGSLADRNPPITGKVFGPYIELDNPRLLAAMDFSSDPPRVIYPGDPGYDNPAFPKVIVDYWGQPIRYYRRAYPPGALGQSYRAGVDRDGSGEPLEPHERRTPSLADVILLRPQQIDEEAAVQGAVTFGGQPIDMATFELQTGEFALFSRGPDQLYNPFVRIDDPADPDYETINLDAGGDPLYTFTNADNIVEVGK